MLKQLYAGGVHALRRPARGVGLLGALERRRGSRAARWGRSLFAIYDIDDLCALDLPWWTFAAIDEVDAFLRARPGARAFEYGSGASSVWLARRTASVHSVEHDVRWSPIVAERLRAYPNATLTVVEPDREPAADPQFRSTKPGWQDRTFRDYVHAIDRVEGEFDLLVIDGRARPACLAHAVKRLAPGGLIVFDNSARAPYRRAIAASGLKARRFRGLAACLPVPDETTLLTRDVP